MLIVPNSKVILFWFVNIICFLLFRLTFAGEIVIATTKTQKAAQDTKDAVDKELKAIQDAKEVAEKLETESENRKRALDDLLSAFPAEKKQKK